MAYIIQKRRDTAANLAATNPILAQGEEAYELDSGKEKIGDGVTAWNDLPYKAVSGNVVISVFEVDKNGNIDPTAFEVGDRFRGWVNDNRYVVGRVIALPFDVDDDTKVKLAVDGLIF